MALTLTLEHNAATARAITRLYQNAAAGHADKVQKLDVHRYVVTSGTSGNQYLVNTALSTCDCTAGQFGRLCRHKIAALTFEAALTRPTPAEPTAAGEPDWQARRRELEASGRLVRRRDRRGRVIETTLDGWTI